MTKNDVTTRLVVKDGKPVLQLKWWKNGRLDHVSYVEDKELIY